MLYKLGDIRNLLSRYVLCHWQVINDCAARNIERPVDALTGFARTNLINSLQKLTVHCLEFEYRIGIA